MLAVSALRYLQVNLHSSPLQRVVPLACRVRMLLRDTRKPCSERQAASAEVALPSADNACDGTFDFHSVLRKYVCAVAHRDVAHADAPRVAVNVALRSAATGADLRAVNTAADWTGASTFDTTGALRLGCTRRQPFMSKIVRSFVRAQCVDRSLASAQCLRVYE